MKVYRSLVVRLFSAILLPLALAACTPAAGLAPTRLPDPTATAAQAAAASTPAAPLRMRVSVEQQANGTSIVHDLDNAYEFTLDQEWMAVPVSEQDVSRVAQASPALDAEFLRLAQKLYASKMDAYRLVGINTDSKLAKAESPTLVLVTAIPDRVSASMPMPALAQMIQDTVFSGAKASEMQRDVRNSASGVSIAVVEGPYDYYSTQEVTLKTRSKVIGFQVSGRVVLIQFITPVEFGSAVLPGTDQIIDSIQRIKP